ncbi:MAG TPA: hypothetical protein VH394_01590 [Thermoanaerobaculia bacterium]|jgi:hypothetical protein|nr:hypothetical protein [Thermoanaerobaculia bacterium]
MMTLGGDYPRKDTWGEALAMVSHDEFVDICRIEPALLAKVR